MLADLRIVSLLPSATEIVAGLGYANQLVGRSHECDFPASVERLPALTRSSVSPQGSSAAIDARVRERAKRSDTEQALGIYDVLTDELRQVEPTHVVTQTQCEVCAVSLRDVEQALAETAGIEARLISLAAADLEGVWDDFRRTAAALGDPGAGERLVGRCRRRLAGIEKQINSRRPRTAVLEWLEPLMGAGHWTPELLRIAGGECVTGSAGELSRRLSWDDLLIADPDVVILAPCGFGISKTMEELPGPWPWSELRAAREHRIFVGDGHQYFNRPGPRLVETAEILAEILSGGRVDFGHSKQGWRPWQACR